MPVLVANRNISGVEFLDTMRKIVVYNIKRTQKFKIEARRDFGERLDKQTIDIYDLLCQANSTPLVKGDYDNFVERKKLLTQARALLNVYIETLSLCYECYRDSFHGSNVVQFVADNVNKEYGLITGVIDSDKKRYYA